MGLLEETLDSIRGKDEEAVKKAWSAIDNLTKPIGSLGKLEEIIAKMAGITGKTHNKINKKNIVIMCADNGMWDEKLNNCPKELTVTVTKNFVKGITGVCVLGDFFKSDRTVVDIGVDYDFNDPEILNRKVAYGTKDITKGPAMTREECVKAVETGIEVVDDLVKKGYDLFGTGEMGVCNTATSAAVLSGLRKLPADVTVGKGSGITDSQLYYKKKAVQQAIDINKPNSEDPIDVLSKVGGFDIAGICGCFLGAARNNVPIVIDGFISAVAALCAFRLNNKVVDYLFASHLSAEPAIKYIMAELGLTPMVNLNMRLGEGSGCPIAFGIIEAALYVMDNMGTFSDANIDSANFVDIREK
ncbi:nicotinate-nucleotide--dimethylbenzimidazole phosphoribosyltransferase [Clostridium luticellarii]|uniref:Nicotinate-nucleotide--dimethylbenzimidazole phosphoribosyltransferase n=1 Tax=Clostridium luticellarii TaxID=1691940 RepID=A0A2T0BMJ0_9CLOT|nr:nicotinate-nucleotide--dimethylbenzimidazole phosphoribosyltransferase [Clostridium luticellarii]MCI1945251.1 nicotinate-nucleotide--dimethylbenzimidazole phosphoribosyltransferase [Clostridium luticellarii]MCI1968991.1 nicotinate-nucleotide--dimethylbenzimidazole phosphoribosyltransferase [Clostridium luticellarii]MCI1994584.1 nicotinate-nucleotide--dimethylbenzimidazole phosphoribosyltransferase [Clostridium luticellarii]MCI2038919.1 nicotinate-nucleotide--dimethylbenzimidazole phosphoribo